MSVSLPIEVRLPLPAAVDRHHILWSLAGTLVVWHFIALLAVLPWFFSVTGLVLAIAGFTCLAAWASRYAITGC